VPLGPVTVHVSIGSSPGERDDAGVARGGVRRRSWR
jgi:hypothetical protein